MEIKMSVDRIANDIAICYDDNDKKYGIPLRLSNFKVGDIISVVFDGNSPVSATVLEEETQKRKTELSLRTKNLFNINKNN